jgi:ankyrin repeat protein
VLRALAEPVLYLKDRESDWPRAILWAVKSQRTATITKALRAGHDVDLADSQELTPLHHATRHIGDELVQFLVQNGAQIDLSATWHGTPLDYACENWNFQCAIALVDAGACVDPSVLCSCVRSIHVSSEEELAFGGMKELERLHKQLARKLFTSLSTSGLSRHCHEGNTPLLCAVSNNDLPAVQMLLGLGVDANAADHEGITPLMMAAHDLNLGHVKVLLAAGANPNCTSRRGESVLDFLAPNPLNGEMTGILQQLLEYGVDIPDCTEGVSRFFSPRPHGFF